MPAAAAISAIVVPTHPFRKKRSFAAASMASRVSAVLTPAAFVEMHHEAVRGLNVLLPALGFASIALTLVWSTRGPIWRADETGAEGEPFQRPDIGSFSSAEERPLPGAACRFPLTPFRRNAPRGGSRWAQCRRWR